MHKPATHTDTSAWILQVWISFFLAAGTTLFGLYHVPVVLWVKGYTVMGVFFMIGSTFTFAKTTCNNHNQQADTSAWILQLSVAFGMAVLLMAIGIFYIPTNLWIKGYIATGACFVLASSFTLAKTIRDNYEASKESLIPPSLSLNPDEVAALRFTH